jgi:hypothetical protein
VTNITTISHLYGTNEYGEMQNNPNPGTDRWIIGNPGLIDKLNLLRQALNQLNLPFGDKRHVSAVLLLREETNISRHYRKTLK